MDDFFNVVYAKPVKRNSECSSGAIIGIILLIILVFLIIGGCCWKYCGGEYEGFKTIESSENVENMARSGILYNPLYNSPNLMSPGSFIYTQPMGDTDASEYAMTSQGTSGGFLPLQGRAAGVFMKNSSNDNTALPSKDIGNIGGYPNYTKQAQTSTMTAGFNDFGAPFQGRDGSTNKDFSNSYLIDGANRRVCNSGQKCPNLQSQDWWPNVKKGDDGYTLQASDSLVLCGSGDIQNCKGKGLDRFLKSKFSPQWVDVFNKI